MRPRSAETRLRDRGGFTLLELIAALSLTILGLLGSWRLLDQLGDGRDQLRREYVRNASGANGVRLLRALVDRAEASLDSASQFSGDAYAARFVSWCEVPAGWLERCRVTLTLTSSDDASTIGATTDLATSLTLWRNPGSASIRYFDATVNVWQTKSPASLSLPSAIGIVTERDTIVLGIGTGS